MQRRQFLSAALGAVIAPALLPLPTVAGPESLAGPARKLFWVEIPKGLFDAYPETRAAAEQCIRTMVRESGLVAVVVPVDSPLLHPVIWLMEAGGPEMMEKYNDAYFRGGMEIITPGDLTENTL